MVSLNKLSVVLFSAALVSLVVGTYLIHPSIAFIVAGLALAAIGALNLDYEG